MHLQSKINKIDKLVHKLSGTTDKWMSLAIAIDLVDEIMKGILPEKFKEHHKLNHNSQEELALPDPLPMSIFKTQKQQTWFVAHPYYGSSRVVFDHFSDEECSLESHLYWFSERETKQKIAASTQLNDNWEDSSLTKNNNYKVAIDFFLSHDTSKLIMVLSNEQKLRVMEFSDSLSHTQKEILSEKLFDMPDLESIEKNISKQKYIHNYLWNAFQLKEVNNKFYQGISKLYDKLVLKLTSDNEISINESKLFANRLLGRILFIWFLRKMNLINEDIGYFDTDNMNSSDYYEKKLKKLFFHTLNTPISKREITNQDEKTPYLNGGLFDIKENDFADKKINFPSNYFDHLFNHFNEFNFTVDESSVNYEFVAVDPEMLGQIFESLLASHNNEDNINERKNSGSFYTPRTIVDYMCKESIRQYLYREIDNEKNKHGIDNLIDMTDAKFIEQKSSSTLDLWGVNTRSIVPKIKKALENVKIMDPAVGSGAFPIGMLQVISKLYERILGEKYNSYNVKWNVIKNNIYGVDKEPMAIEISRLRAWLALIVEDYQDDEKIHPLPNLEFKFVSANSLVKLDNYENEYYDPELENKLSEIRQSYFRATSKDSKDDYQKKYFKITSQPAFFDGKRGEQLRSFDPFKNTTSASFYDNNYIFGISDGFDIVIGNPPYLQEGKAPKEHFENISYYQGKMDIWYSFMCLGIDNLTQGGIIAFIAKNNWLTNYGASILRNKVIKETKINKIIDFNDYMVFDSAWVQTMITILTKDNSDNEYSFDYRKINNKNQYLSNIDSPIEEILGNKNNDTILRLNPMINRLIQKDTNLYFSVFDDLLDIISFDAKYLLKTEIAQGIVFPQDMLNKKNARWIL